MTKRARHDPNPAWAYVVDRVVCRHASEDELRRVERRAKLRCEAYGYVVADATARAIGAAEQHHVMVQVTLRVARPSDQIGPEWVSKLLRLMAQP